MKILYIGGQKSGKSLLAEKRVLLESKLIKPFYIATYDNSYGDNSMKKRVKRHKQQRKNNFITIEATTKLHRVIKKDQYYIIDCLSMWLLNHIDLKKKRILSQLKTILSIDAHIIFVLNDGIVKSVGWNSKGQLGMGNTTDVGGHIQTTEFKDVISIGTCHHSTILVL